MDRVEASKKLSRLTIPEVIIQAGNRKVQEKIPPQDIFAEDGIIPVKATLGHRLIKEGVLGYKEFVCLPGRHHLNYAEIFEATNKTLLRYFPKNSLPR